MELKIRPIEIPSTEPFVNDELEREREVENLTNLLVNVKTPLVLAIDAKWGSGKTTFIKMWETSLSIKGIFSLYFNAWETDFAEDPLIAFLGELNSSIDTRLGNDTVKTKLWEKTKKIGCHIAKRSLPVAVKLATAGLVDADQLLEKELSELNKQLIDDAVKSYGQTKSLIDEFKVNLNEILLSSTKEYNGPIFIFIDELDRCRPTYALELLERVKHILDIDNLVFVLSLDRFQLGNSIKSVYGNDIDHVNYLRRFIDIEYSLRQPNRMNYIVSIYKKFGFEEFFDKRNKYEAFRYEKDSFLKIFNTLADGFNLSLREIEQFFTKMYLVILSTKENVHLYAPLLIILIFLKEKNNNLYSYYTNPSNNGDEIVLFFRKFINDNERVKMYHFALLEAFIIGSKKKINEEISSAIIVDHMKTLKNESSTSDEKYYAERVITIAKEPIDWRSGIHLEDLVKRVEMAEQFNVS